MVFLQKMAASGMVTRNMHKQELIESEVWIIARGPLTHRTSQSRRGLCVLHGFAGV